MRSTEYGAVPDCLTEAILKAYEDSGLSKQEFSKQFCRDRKWLYSLRDGIAGVTPDQVRILCEKYHLDANEVLGVRR